MSSRPLLPPAEAGPVLWHTALSLGRITDQGLTDVRSSRVVAGHPSHTSEVVSDVSSEPLVGGTSVGTWFRSLVTCLDAR